MNHLGRLGLLLSVCVLGPATDASAATFCVADAGCVAAGGTAQSTVQGALDTAAVTAGDDVVQLGPGTFTAPGPAGFAAGSTGAVELRGAGRTQTTLVGATAATNANVYTLRLTVDGSAVHDLKVVLPTNPSCGASIGIKAPTVAIDRVDVVTSSSSCNYSGIEADGTLRDSTATVPDGAGGASALRVNDGSTGTVEDSVLRGYYAVYADSQTATPTVVTVRRSRLTGGAYTLYQLNATALTVESSLVRTSVAGAVGLSVRTPKAGSIATALVRNATFPGPGKAVVVDSSTAGSIASVTLRSSIIRGPGTSLTRTATTGTANLTAAYSDYVPPPPGASSGAGTLNQTTGNTTVADPRFADEAGGDLRLRLDSPLRDAGDPAALAGGESATDLAGAPRLVDGNGDATARRDVGAFEYQPQTPVAAVAVTPPTVLPGQAATFDGSASHDPEAGDALTYAWAFDDGATATTPTVQHAFTTPGVHQGTLTVRDSTGQVGTAVGTVTVATPVVPPPARDTKKPVLTGLRLAPATFRAAARGGAAAARARRVAVGTTVRYAVSEASTVTFGVQRRTSGRRVGAACRAVTRSNRRAKPCIRYQAVKGTVVRTDAAGARTFRLTGRIGGRRLKAGRYRLTAVPVDQAGNTGAAARVSFAITA